jgi:hypothetical protein
MQCTAVCYCRNGRLLTAYTAGATLYPLRSVACCCASERVASSSGWGLAVSRAAAANRGACIAAGPKPVGCARRHRQQVATYCDCSMGHSKRTSSQQNRLWAAGKHLGLVGSSSILRNPRTVFALLVQSVGHSRVDDAADPQHCRASVVLIMGAADVQHCSDCWAQLQPLPLPLPLLLLLPLLRLPLPLLPRAVRHSPDHQQERCLPMHWRKCHSKRGILFTTFVVIGN